MGINIYTVLDDLEKDTADIVLPNDFPFKQCRRLYQYSTKTDDSGYFANVTYYQNTETGEYYFQTCFGNQANPGFGHCTNYFRISQETYSGHKLKLDILKKEGILF